MNLKKILDSLIKDNVIFAADVDEAIQHFTAQGFTNVEVEETGEFSSETGEKEFRLISDSCGKKRKKVKDADMQLRDLSKSKDAFAVIEVIKTRYPDIADDLESNLSDILMDAAVFKSRVNDSFDDEYVDESELPWDLEPMDIPGDSSPEPINKELFNARTKFVKLLPDTTKAFAYVDDLISKYGDDEVSYQGSLERGNDFVQIFYEFRPQVTAALRLAKKKGVKAEEGGDFSVKFYK